MNHPVAAEPEVELDVLAPWGPAGPPAPGLWSPDVLGPGFLARTIELIPDEEGEAVATLVRYRPPDPSPSPRAQCLYLHGRNDYFFQTELARELARAGVEFFALDLRKYGRSLRPWQTIGYAADFSVYEEEIGQAIEIMQQHTPGLPLLLMGHSTGGLLATLWAYRRPGAVAGLILNSAWLELQAMAAWRPALQQILGRIASRRPRAIVISNSKPDYYGPSLTKGWAGSGLEPPAYFQAEPDDPALVGWKIFPEWKRNPSYPVPAAWLEAIMAAQDRVEKEVHLDCPVLSLCSTKAASAETWSPDVFDSDTVLDPEVIVERSAKLADLVTIARLPGKHDLLLSDPPVRRHLYRLMHNWIEAMVPANS